MGKVNLKAIYCPICRNKLEIMHTDDILVEHWMCKNMHRYYSPVEEVYTSQTGINYTNLRNDASELKELIKAWLSKNEYRKHLNNQIAELLRVYLDAKENNYSIAAQKERKYKYCFMCGESLSEFESGDLYASGLRCDNGHTYYLRDCLHVKDGVKITQLCQYMDYDFFTRCLSSYLENNHLSKNVPMQIREVLRKIKNDLRSYGV